MQLGSVHLGSARSIIRSLFEATCWARPGIVGSKHDWLVGGWPTPLKNMKVWLDRHPNYWGKYGKWWKSFSSHHQPVEVDEVNSQEDAEQKASRRTNPQWPPPPSWRAQQLPVLRAKSARADFHRDFNPGIIGISSLAVLRGAISSQKTKSVGFVSPQ